MADTKIENESSAGALDGAEIVPVVRGSGSPPTYANFRTTTQDIANLSVGRLALIATRTANNTATSVEWTGLSGDDYLLIVRGLTPATNGADILLQMGTGGTPTWITTGYHSVQRYWVESSGINGLTNYASTSGINLANAVDNSNGGLVGCNINLFGLSMAIRHAVNFTSLRMNGSAVAQLIGGGTVSGTTAKTAARLITSSGNLSSGSASLYRIVP